MYRANSKVSRNPNFCVGCFELIRNQPLARARSEQQLPKVEKAVGSGYKQALWLATLKMQVMMDRPTIHLETASFIGNFCCMCKGKNLEPPPN